MRASLSCFVLVGTCVLAACGDGGGDPPSDGSPPLMGDLYSLNWGSLVVHPGDEGTRCVDLRLSNASEIRVHQLHNTLSQGSHHVIVYKNDDPAAVEQATPYECNPFTGALNVGGTVAPMMITQKQDDALTLPDGVAYTLAAGQMIRIEMHYINSSDHDLEVTEHTDFYAADPATIHDEANILFIGTPDIKIPAGMPFTVEQFFTPSRANLDLSTAKFFAITGHTHQWGTDMQVQTAATKGATRTSVYAPSPFQWAEPETETHNPEFMLPAGGGFNFKCDYQNGSNAEVTFGESANDEMCFFWAYYYPSKGSHVCVHSDNYGNADVCCPDAGPQLCGQIINAN